MEPDGDGVKRYVVELLTQFSRLPEAEQQHWTFDLYIYGDIVGLQDYLHELRFEKAQRQYGLLWYEKYLLRLKAVLKRLLPAGIYAALAPLYRHSPIRWMLQRIKKIGKAAGRWFRPLRKDPRFSKYDLIHLPLPQHEDSFKGLKIPLVATVHDLTDTLFPQWHQSRNIRLANKGMQFLLRERAHFICVSEATRQDLLHHFVLQETQATVVYEAADRQWFSPRKSTQEQQRVREKYGLPQGKFLLALGTIEPRKNVKRILDAFDQLYRHQNEARLVVAGKYGWKNREVMKSYLHHPGIHFTGFVSDTDLPVLYTMARALVYVSLYEGFGLPPLEAMCCGTPVLYANRSSLPEVVGPGGLPVDPEDTPAITNGMSILLNNEKAWAKYSERAQEQAKQFSWEKCASATLAVYSGAISSATSRTL